jgi:hypothetical protein
MATMVNCHPHFLTFDYEITPSLAELERSLEIRRLVRKGISAHCRHIGLPIRFHAQGSFRLLTAVRRDGLDLDDGILFRAESFVERPSIGALQEIVFEALRHRGFAVFTRQPCLRLLHARGVRSTSSSIWRMRTVRFAWRIDPMAGCRHFIAWFETPADPQATAQMRRLVKYYKMWAARMAPQAMATGIVLTILIKTLHHSDRRDDVALARTMRAVVDHLEAGNGCLRPTPPTGEDLLKDELTRRQLGQFVSLLRGFVEIAERAIATAETERALGAPGMGDVARLNYPAVSTDKRDARLTVRDRESDSRTEIPAGSWEFVDPQLIRLLPAGTHFERKRSAATAARSAGIPFAGA